LHTWFVPHTVPFALGVALMQTERPVAQSVAPSWQSGSGCVAQDRFAAHGAQAPALHTWSTPQAVPFATLLPVSPQTGVPVEQETIPAWQEFAGVHAAPPTHASPPPDEPQARDQITASVVKWNTRTRRVLTRGPL
jgi:hypothetical protein